MKMDKLSENSFSTKDFERRQVRIQITWLPNKKLTFLIITF